MSTLSHGIMKFGATGVIAEKIKGRKSLVIALNKLEKQLKQAVRAKNVQSDIQISLLRYQLSIIGLFNLYIQEVGIFDPRELKRYRLVPQPVFRFLHPAICSASKILNTLDCGASEIDTMKAIKIDQQDYLGRIYGKKKGTKTKGRVKKQA